jgi:DmsE family decaheme c-type cytochrome
MIEHSRSQLIFRKRLALAALSLCFVTGGTALAADDDAEATEAEYAKSSKMCLACHGEGRAQAAHEILLTRMAVTADPAAPMADGNHGCESCHGPSKAHTKRAKDGTRPSPAITFKQNEPAELKNGSCLTCHDNGSRFHWMGSMHDIQETACVDCHDLHVENDPVLALESQPEVCYSCHAEQRAQFMRQSRHPVQAASQATSHIGLMTCTDCHKPHGSAGEASLVQNTINETCYECHAEKRGPFVFEHQPVREDCSTCHQPHGSNYEPLLNGRAPWLCQQCHDAWNHPSTAYSGTGIPPEGAAPQVLANQCLNCHNQVHGSNHPSGPGFTR